jgi:hypothetical protein
MSRITIGPGHLPPTRPGDSFKPFLLVLLACEALLVIGALALWLIR